MIFRTRAAIDRPTDGRQRAAVDRKQIKMKNKNEKQNNRKTYELLLQVLETK